MVGNTANIANNFKKSQYGLNMALKKYKPITAGTRWRIGNAYAEITTDTPEKSLLEKQVIYRWK